jgi:hypothetical protein
MFISMPKIPLPSVALEQALADIIESIAVEETALSNILHSEGEVLHKTKKVSGDIGAFIYVNESVNCIIKNVVRLQMLMQFMLEDAEGLLQKIGDVDENDELEE